MTESIADIIRGQARIAPDRCAFIEPDRKWTFRELDDATDRIANGLVAAGVTPGDAVGTVARGLGPCLLTALGAAKCGAVSVPFNLSSRRCWSSTRRTRRNSRTSRSANA
jgi:fatty-acyl-CoA synthase